MIGELYDYFRELNDGSLCFRLFFDLQKLAYSEPFKKKFYSVWWVWQRTSYLSYPILSWYTYRLTNREFQIIPLVNYKGGFD